MLHKSSSGLTRMEATVVLAVIGFMIVFIFGPHLFQGETLDQGQRINTLSRMKQLHLATRQMALDGIESANPNLGWPGDTGGSFSNWTAQLLEGNYLSRQDLGRLLSAPGVIVSMDDPLTNNHTALLVYAVSTNSPATAIFLSTANFTNTPTGGLLNTNALPYRGKGFVVLRAGGDGAVLKASQAGKTNDVSTYVQLCH